MEWHVLWNDLFWPLIRLLLGMSFGLLLANVLEIVRWTETLARFAAPLARAAHLRDITAAAFSTAFVSPAAANGLLAENYTKGTLSRREVVLSNIFNSFPSYITHTPSIFLLTWPVLGFPAVIYVGLSLTAAMIRTILVIFLARILLPKPPVGCVPCHLEKSHISIRSALHKAFMRFKKRLPRLLVFTVPIYCIVFIFQHNGIFDHIEIWLSQYAAWIPYIPTEALGIVALHLAAELGAALSAASALLHGNSLSSEQVVIALLIGNILSTPARALRHQLPSYSGFFAPKLALQLIITNQGLRALSMMAITIAYAWWVRA